MFRIFKTRNDSAMTELRSTSSAPWKQGPSIQSEVMSDEELLESLAILSRTTGSTVVQHGARLAVIGELLATLLTHLPDATRVEIAGSFRERVEDLMSLCDDRALPEQYHSALLTEVNRYLNALR
jgi:hypothetical protein